MATITGMNQLVRKLKRLESKVAKKIVRTGVRDGSKVFQKEVKSNILSMLTGGRTLKTKAGKTKVSSTLEKIKGRLSAAMHNAIIVRGIKKQKKGQWGANVQFNLTKQGDVLIYKGKGKRQFIPAAIEYGHRLFFMGHDTGKKTRPIPFARKAFDSKDSTAKQTAIDSIKSGILSEARK